MRTRKAHAYALFSTLDTNSLYKYESNRQDSHLLLLVLFDWDILSLYGSRNLKAAKKTEFGGDKQQEKGGKHASVHPVPYILILEHLEEEIGQDSKVEKATLYFLLEKLVNDQRTQRQ
jgi:hypothetical protein